MFTSRADICVTLTPGTSRIISTSVGDGAALIASSVTTVIVAGALISCSSRLEAVTTTTSPDAGASAGTWVGWVPWASTDAWLAPATGADTKASATRRSRRVSMVVSGAHAV